jgi:hypothetical protein
MFHMRLHRRRLRKCNRSRRGYQQREDRVMTRRANEYEIADHERDLWKHDDDTVLVETAFIAARLRLRRSRYL